MSSEENTRQGSEHNSRKYPNKSLIRILSVILTAIMAFCSLIIPLSTRPSSYTLDVGDVTVQDIQAPFDLTYSSELLTEQEREKAEKSIQPIYLNADPAIARQQLESLRVSLNFINAIRQDGYSTPDQKVNDLSAMSDITLDRSTIETILSLNETRWQALSQETISVLEQVMRRTIREDQLAETRQNLISLISFSIPEEQAEIIAKLASSFVKANSLYDQDATTTARNNARQSVIPISRTFIQGQIIISRGSIISPLDKEALREFGLVAPSDTINSIISSMVAVGLLTIVTVLYIRVRKLAPLTGTKGIIVVSLVFMVFLLGSRFVIPNRTILPYLFPIPAFGLTIASLFTLEVGIILSLSLSILSAFQLSASLDLTIFYFVSTIVGMLILGKGKRIINFFWAGLAIGFSGTIVVLAYRLNDPGTDLIGLATLTGGAFLNGMASASLTLLLQFIISQLLGQTTSLQLLDLSRSEHPLLQLILRKIPGSYQHSLQVANLAEQAAEAIGADSLLTRVGALYHDSGKIMNPSFFVENQPPNQINTHDDLDPVESAAIIIKHISDGLTLAQKYGIPSRVQDFIREHHGTLLTRYQYSKALAQAENNPKAVNENLFRYPGPKPRSRETALLMLADGCEARVRAELPQTEAELRNLVQRTFEHLQNAGQLDDTPLTFNELSTARESFINALKNTYHPRMKYPEIKSN